MPQKSEDILENFIFNGRNPCISLKHDTMIVKNMLNKLTKKYKEMTEEVKAKTVIELRRHRRDTSITHLSFEEEMFLDELSLHQSSTTRTDTGERAEGLGRHMTAEEFTHWIAEQYASEAVNEAPVLMFTQSDYPKFTDRFNDALRDRRIIYEKLEELSIEKPDLVENWIEIFDMIVNYPRNILKCFPKEYEEIFGEKNCDVFFSYLRPDYKKEYNSESEKKSLNSNLQYEDERDVEDNCDALTRFEKRCENKKTDGLYCSIHQDYQPPEENNSERNDHYEHDSSNWGKWG